MYKDGIVVLTHSVGCYYYICTFGFPTTFKIKTWHCSSTLRDFIINNIEKGLIDTKKYAMAQLINYGREMLRINLQKNVIEYSTNEGRSWMSRYTGSSCGIFADLFQYGKELLACTNKGLYYSTNEGRSWMSRYTGSSCGAFMQLSTDGRNLLATTNKGLFYSTNEGRSWMKR